MPKQGERAMWAGLGVVSGLGMALAAWLFIAPDVGPPPTIPFQDKIFHALAFACLAGPGVLVLPRRASRMMAVFGGFSPIVVDIVSRNPHPSDVEVSHGHVGWM